MKSAKRRIVIAAIVLFVGLLLFRRLVSPWSAFERALTFGDVVLLEKHLKANPSLANKKIRYGDTPLNIAVRGQHPKEAVELLMKYGADINARGWPFNTTPLQAAAWSGKTEAVKVLLAHHPNLDATNDDSKDGTGDGSTALNYALVADNKEVFNLLLDAGADINHGRSTLAECMMYAESARLGWAEFLLSKGANPDRKTSADRFPPLIQAVLSGATNNVAALLRYNVNTKVFYDNGADHFTPLELALDEHYLDVALMLARADLQARTNSASLAAVGDDPDLLRKLLADNPAAIKQQDALGFTPLHWSAVSGRKEAVELLLSLGANPNTIDQVRYNPLEWSAYMGHLPVVELLVAKTQANNQHGVLNTPLVLAVQKGRLDVAQFLLKNGADAKAVNPLDRSLNQPLHFAASSDSKAMVELLLENGADVKAINAGREVAFHSWVLGSSNLQIADLLLSRGADINAKNQQGDTPLHLAIELAARNQGQKQVILWLLDHKADVNAKNGEGKTPLSLLKWKNRGRETERRKDIADLLRSHGAK